METLSDKEIEELIRSHLHDKNKSISTKAIKLVRDYIAKNDKLVEFTNKHNWAVINPIKFKNAYYELNNKYNHTLSFNKTYVYFKCTICDSIGFRDINSDMSFQEIVSVEDISCNDAIIRQVLE